MDALLDRLKKKAESEALMKATFRGLGSRGAALSEERGLNPKP